MMEQYFHVLQILAIFVIIFAMKPILSASQNYPIAKPGCTDHCGNIRIPYPFGTKENCYQNRNFLVTCNETFSPPRLFLRNSLTGITDINLDGQLRVLQFVGRDCYARNGRRVFKSTPWLNLPRHLTVNNIVNKFTIVGCDTYGFVAGRRRPNRTYSAGCIAMCTAREDLEEGSCVGSGCCQISIPQDVEKVQIQLTSFKNYTNVFDFNNCGFAFFAEENTFNFSAKNLTNLWNVTKLPMVIDWAIGNGTCEDAQKNNSTYACISRNSKCYKPENGDGYRCTCQDGYEGNPYLHDGCRDIDECEVHRPSKCKYDCVNTEGGFYCPCPKGYRGDGTKGGEGCSESLTFRLVAGIAFGVIILLLAASFLYFELKRRRSNRMKKKYFDQNGGMMLQEKLAGRETSSHMVRIFTSSELHKATNDFNNNMIVGQGGFGIVYKGVLPDNSIVAIKKSRKINDRNEIEQFINEVFVLSQINHRNVVKLLGCCLETEAPHLVYEFISNGTLSAHIHNEARARFLNWEMRLKIAAETAGVLSYLHSAASIPIIHRDVKSDNILLDDSLIAKVADFGASRLVPLDQTEIPTVVQGTIGYLDPEYMQTNQLTEKSDVYSFGIVLLELLTGRKPTDKPGNKISLASYFVDMLKQDRLVNIVDDNIAGDSYREQIEEVAKLAKGCINMNGEDRPSMQEVAMELEGLRLGEKRSWERNKTITKEMESLLGDPDQLNDDFVTGDGSTSIGYDSLGDQNVVSMSGGR